MTEPEVSSAAGAALGLLQRFVALGLRDIVVAPGSRSQALALAAAALDRTGVVRLHVRIDERSAAFLALGLGVESGVPAAVITTSGTAVANLHPAVLEAHHAGVPVLLLTADRPEELRGIGANQTTAQAHLFGGATRLSEDVDTTSLGEAGLTALAERAWTAALQPGPVQLNLAFREPLSAALPDPLPELATEHLPQQPTTTGRDLGPTLELTPEPGTLVIAGAGAGPAAEEAAHQLHAPLLAEVASGARYGRNLIAPYRAVLAEPGFTEAVRRVIVFGHPTLSREVPALIAREDVETVVVRSAAAEDYSPGRRVRRFAGAITVHPAAPAALPELRSWLGAWVTTARAIAAEAEQIAAPDLDAAHASDRHERAKFVQQEFAAIRTPLTRSQVVDAVWGATWPHDRLVLGASRLIRVADEVLPGKRVPVHANRGLAGIDGTIATGIGIALAHQASDARAGVTRVLLGDLALLHDAGSLLFGDGETRPRIQVIVGDDHGGTLFTQLEVAATAPAADFDRVLRTPQSVDVAALAAAYGWEYRPAKYRGDLDRALTAATTGPVLIHVTLADDPA